MPCSAYTSAGHLCHNRDIPGQPDVPDYITVCRIHGRAHARHVAAHGDIQPQPNQCIRYYAGWCRNPRSEGSHYCQRHVEYYTTRGQREERRVEQQRLHVTLLNDLLDRNPRPTVEDVTRELFNQHQLPERIRYQIAFSYAHEIDPEEAVATFRRVWDELERAAAPPPPPPRGTTLAALARDSQNVHTRAVVEQTNATEALLLAVPIPPDQQTEATIAAEWIRLHSRAVSWGRILKTLADVHIWFGKATCRQENDNLYRRLLRTTVAKINRTGDLRDELYRRLWEECSEAVGMCCEGHISRLCNVFVGFDDAFPPQISTGELLQQKLAAIAMSDLPEEEKRSQATAFMTELGIPTEEQVPWIEALA